MSNVIEAPPNEILDAEQAERKFTDSAEELRAAYASHESAERRIQQIRAALQTVNQEQSQAATELAAAIESLEETLLATGAIDSKVVRRILDLRSAHAFLADMATNLAYLKLPETQLALREAEIAVLDALANRFSARAELQRVRRDSLLTDVAELEGEVRIDSDSGKTGEFRRLAAEHRLSAERGREALVALREDLDKRKAQAFRFIGK